MIEELKHRYSTNNTIRGSTVGFLLFQCCCSTPQGSPGVGRNTLFLSSPPHLCFIIVFICDLFVSRDDP